MKNILFAFCCYIVTFFLSGCIDDRRTESPLPRKETGGVVEVPKISTDYDRKEWTHWIDEDNDCQNTRMEILIRDNSGLLKYKRNNQCTVTWGKWVCPYTGKEFTKASDMDIDHVVPLAHAYRSGGAGWSRARKREFANDPMNLLAVEDDINRAKADQGPDEWRPPMKSYWPEYAGRWRAVKKKYRLSISPEEEASLQEMGQKNNK